VSKPDKEAKPGRGRIELSVDQLRSWKLLAEFRRVLGKTAPTLPGPRPKGGPGRLLEEEDYLCAFLFAQFNPVITSMRALCACSKLKRVREDVCSRPMSLGSFSEAQGVFGHARLEEVFKRLVGQKPREGVARGTGATDGLAALELVDSSVFKSLPRMAWAEWRYQNKTQCAVRLHLQFNLLEEKPSGALVSEARLCERKAFARMVEPGGFYVGDRNYSRDYKLLSSLEEIGCGYIIRLCENADLTVIEDLPIDASDRAAGVVSDQIVRLGSRKRWHCGPVRVVRIEKPELDEPLLLVTNRLDPESFSAALVGEIYHQRWAIELFFRWIKCVLGRPNRWHWLAESAEGVHIQIYSALIAALLLARRLGRLPNKRCMEMLQFHSMGMADDEELEAFLEEQMRKRSA
jgi:hypothetical protein